MLALTALPEWRALEASQVLTDIEMALPPPGQAAEAREAALACFEPEHRPRL